MGVSVRSAVQLGASSVALHVPMSDAAAAECVELLTSAREVTSPARSGWYARARSGPLLPCLAQVLAAGALGDPSALDFASGVRPEPLDPERLERWRASHEQRARHAPAAELPSDPRPLAVFRWPAGLHNALASRPSTTASEIVSRSLPQLMAAGFTAEQAQLLKARLAAAEPDWPPASALDQRGPEPRPLLASLQELCVRSDLYVRSPRPEALEALDAALCAWAPAARVQHFADPRRTIPFELGGPAVWSVGMATAADGSRQLLTYGLSRALDPTSSLDFELALRIPGGDDAVWACLLLRGLARYQRRWGELAPGQVHAPGLPISRTFAHEQQRAQMEDTQLETCLIMGGAPLVTAHGPVLVHHVVGLDRDLHDLLDSVRPARFCTALERLWPSLRVDLAGPPPGLKAALSEVLAPYAASEGGDSETFAVDDLSWSADDDAYEVHFPPGSAQRVHRRLITRLPFGRGLRVHALQPFAGSEVQIVPSETLAVHDREGCLVVELPADSPHVHALAVVGEEGAVWRFVL